MEVKIKKRHRVVKSQGGGVALVVGENFRLEQILDLNEKTLVGKYLGKRVSMEQLNLWIQQTWLPLLGNFLSFHILAHGWLGFLFRTKEETMSIPNGSWFMDSSFSSIKPWHPLFDEKEKFVAKTSV